MLSNFGYDVVAALRRKPDDDNCLICRKIFVGDIGPNTQWECALKNVDCVIHLAARVHATNNDTTICPLAEFRRVNSAGTAHFAKQAAKIGVKRFLYVSSIKVNGEKTTNYPFTADDIPNPIDPYSISKAEAEELLQKIGASTSMEIVIVRPPLIYGPGIKSNFLSLIKLVEKRLPLPLAKICNCRSMVSLHNVSDLLVRCIEHPRAVGEIFLVSDDIGLSTPELIQSIAQHLGVRVVLLPMPLVFLKLIGRGLGQLGKVNRLCNSLEVDISKTRELLGWTPVESTDKGMKETIDWYVGKKT